MNVVIIYDRLYVRGPFSVTSIYNVLNYMYSIVALPQVPTPRDISDDQLQKLVQSGDATQFRVPLSLGEPHTEKDNG